MGPLSIGCRYDRLLRFGRWPHLSNGYATAIEVQACTGAIRWNRCGNRRSAAGFAARCPVRSNFVYSECFDCLADSVRICFDYLSKGLYLCLLCNSL